MTPKAHTKALTTLVAPGSTVVGIDTIVCRAGCVHGIYTVCLTERNGTCECTHELLLAASNQQLGAESGGCGGDICILWDKVWFGLFGKEHVFGSFLGKEGTPL